MSVLRSHREQLLRLLEQARAENKPPEVLERLEWFIDFATHRSISKTCRTFSIARTTFYRWLKRFDPNNLDTLADQPLAAALSAERFTAQHAIGEQPNLRPKQEPAEKLSQDANIALQQFLQPRIPRGWATLGIGALATGLLVNLLVLGAFLVPTQTLSLRATLFGQEPVAVTESVTPLPEAIAGSGVELRISGTDVPAHIDLNDCTPSRVRGNDGWTCSLRIEP